MTRYSVVLVPFPFDDLSSTKVRPAVCLTDPIGPHRHLVLAFITSRIPDKPLASDLVIDTRHGDFRQTGLRVSSTLQLHRLMAVTTSVLKRRLGTLPAGLRSQVEVRLRELFRLEK